MTTAAKRRRKRRSAHPRRWVRVLRTLLAALVRERGTNARVLDDARPLRAAVRSLPATRGICRVCGCTFFNPCHDGHLGCRWVDASRTLCSVCHRTLMEGNS